MSTEFVQRVLQMIEADVQSRPTAVEFEMAYQARVAIDRIRFAIKATDQFAHNPLQFREAGLQLLDALDRLESPERHFQKRFRRRASGDHDAQGQPVNGKAARQSPGDSV
jgi:hypothetical protein